MGKFIQTKWAIIDTIAAEVYDLEEGRLELEKIHRKIGSRLHKKYPDEWYVG